MLDEMELVIKDSLAPVADKVQLMPEPLFNSLLQMLMFSFTSYLITVI